MMTVAVQRFDRSAALIDGTVRMDNVLVLGVSAGRVGVDGVLNGTFDAAEMPLARYIFCKDQGDPITAVPVFPDRLMLHQYVYVRTDRGIEGPADLRGRRVLMPGYFITASFWHRARLKAEGGVGPREVEWFTTSPELDRRIRIPEGVKVTVASGGSRHGVERLVDGTADCVMTEDTIRVPPAQRHLVKHLDPNVYTLQRDWHKKTGFFPIVHVIVVRNESLKARPDFGRELCQAYDQARAHAYRVLQNERMTSLPFMRAILDEVVELCGDDPWSYGLERNRAELDTLLGYAHEEGYVRRRSTPEELFDPRSLEYAFTSRIS
jgi:4,5-dihydroxyphthalate decarboxylase